MDVNDLEIGVRRCPYTNVYCVGYECAECSVYLEEHEEDEEDDNEHIQ